MTVPGAAAGWLKTIETFGSGKLSMKEILAPAIRMARDGVPEHELNSVAVSVPRFHWRNSMLMEIAVAAI